eukprot:1691122-Pleurochrysis_carterae.AAC.2
MQPRVAQQGSAHWAPSQAINALEQQSTSSEEATLETCEYVLFALNRNRTFNYVKVTATSHPFFEDCIGCLRPSLLLPF